ncbi:MAG TPA: TonB-dependent receptor [Alphaproteobacteria bacterium]|nr:TonB-dependent receptor [Alphaproteobacteria bacterium]
MSWSAERNAIGAWGAVSVLAISACLPLARASAAEDAAQSTVAEVGALPEVMVTAQRRSESLANVPISVSAFSQARMDMQGVRKIDDLARLTPGISFARADARNGLASNIAIRGISSTAGSSTTGIYIDDTPIQSRSLGYSAFNSFPEVFDVERVEVLRGPQGTLFGAGSEGGTVRFITPQPNLDKFSAYARSELGYTESGDPSYEAGAAIGAPIVQDKVGFRISGWYRRDGGWVDRVDWDRTTHAPTNTLDNNSNWQNSIVLKAALTFAPSENLSITPSIYYQDLRLNDTPSYWAVLSDPSNGKFNNGNALAAVSKDKFVLPSLKIELHLGGVDIVSNTSYFDRHNHSINDYSAFEAGIWAANAFFPAGFYAPTNQYNVQKNWTQEVRFQSANDDARLTWVIGGFFTHAHQSARQFVQDTFLPALFQANTGIPFNAFFGQGLVDGLYTFVADPIEATDKQIAGYGQADLKVTDKLTLTAGIRVARTTVDAQAKYRGPVVGPDVADSGSQKESPITPKGSISYKIDADNMVYASVAKGYRIGGYNPRVGLPCGGQLASLGLPAAPQLYSSDHVWSYEVGSKNSFAGGRLRVSSSAFYVDWGNIQQQVALNSCGFTFVTNLGSATSKGVDFQVEVEPVDDLVISLSFGYTNAKFDQTVQGGPAATTNLVTKGDHIPGSPWTGAFSAQYNFTAFGDHDSFARVDYQYQSGQSGITPGTNPTNGTFNPSNLFLLPETNLLSARIGTKLSDVDLSIFVNNLLNSHTILSQSTPPGPVILYQRTTFRPRTVGLTAIYRY